MRLTLVTRNLPPTKCGVADYSFCVATAMQQLGHFPTLVGQAPQTQLGGQIPFTARTPDWSFFKAKALFEEIRSTTPDLLVLQWVPSLYDKRGMSMLLPALGALARQVDIPLVTVVHETWVAFDRWAHFVSGPVQRAGLALLGRSSLRLLVSTAAWATELKLLFPNLADRVQHLPVASNIPYRPALPGPRLEAQRAARATFQFTDAGPYLGLFSPLGSGKGTGLVQAAWADIRRTWPGARLVVIGVTAEEARDALNTLTTDPQVSWTGRLEPNEVSLALQTLDVFLAPLVDGLSTRRASVLAALEHGVPTVSTTGHLFDPLFANGPLVITNYEPGAFSAGAMRLCEEAAGDRQQRSHLTRDFYQSHFSWESIAKAIIARCR